MVWRQKSDYRKWRQFVAVIVLEVVDLSVLCACIIQNGGPRAAPTPTPPLQLLWGFLMQWTETKCMSYAGHLEPIFSKHAWRFWVVINKPRKQNTTYREFLRAEVWDNVEVANRDILCPRLGAEWIGRISWLPRAPLEPIFMTGLPER